MANLTPSGLCKPSKPQMAVIRAMARGRKLDTCNSRGSGRLTGLGLKPVAVSASDMWELLYEVEAITDKRDGFAGDGYELTGYGIDLAKYGSE